MKSKCFLIFLALALEFSVAARADLAAIFTNAAPAAAAPRPSIIFIQCHDLARGDLSCYGQTHYQTPALDRLASAGVRCTHYTGGAESAATTGLLLAVPQNGASGAELNLAQRLQQSGYHTGLLGEWGLSGQPWTLGFDEFAGFLDDSEARSYYPETMWRYAPRSIIDPATHALKAFTGRESIHANSGGRQGRYLPEVLISAMINFVRINEPDPGNQYRPFFLMVNLPAPRSAVAGADDFPVPTDAPFSGEPWPVAAKNRAALVTRLDEGIGRLFDQLGKMKMSNNVAVFFSSSSAPEKFVDPKLHFLLPAPDFRSPTNGVAAPLPMLVRWPGKIPAGQVSDHPWTAADFGRTALEIARVPGATNAPGQSLLPVLSGKK